MKKDISHNLSIASSLSSSKQNDSSGLNVLKPLKENEIVEGKIIGTGRSCVYVDLGIKGAGIIYGKNFYDAKDIIKDLQIGDKLFAKVVDIDNEEGYVELSLKEAKEEMSWEVLEQKKEKSETITIKILGANKGGLLAEVSGISGFLPVSQLSSEHYPKVKEGDKSEILKLLQKFIGKSLEVKILDLDTKQNKLILSEKAKENDKIKKAMKNYKVGKIVEGEITGITDFGAFIKFPLLSERLTKIKEKASSKTIEVNDIEAPENDIAVPEIEGLIHISELDWKLITNPSEIVKVGQKIKAKIIEIANDRIYLSLKALKKDPWKDIEKKYKKGDIVKGIITKFNPFGVFVQISPKIQALCHISEFNTKKEMEEILKESEEYNFQILSIEPEKHRMTLRLASPVRDYKGKEGTQEEQISNGVK